MKFLAAILIIYYTATYDCFVLTLESPGINSADALVIQAKRAENENRLKWYLQNSNELTQSFMLFETCKKILKENNYIKTKYVQLMEEEYPQMFLHFCKKIIEQKDHLKASKGLKVSESTEKRLNAPFKWGKRDFAESMDDTNEDNVNEIIEGEVKRYDGRSNIPFRWG